MMPSGRRSVGILNFLPLEHVNLALTLRGVAVAPSQYLEALPDPCIKYLLLVGTTGTLCRPNDIVFPSSIMKECQAKCSQGECKRLSELTFNDLQQQSVMYPLSQEAHLAHPEDAIYEYHDKYKYMIIYIFLYSLMYTDIAFHLYIINQQP